MTRRIGWAVLLTCWATLLCAAGAIYWSVHSSVLQQLDRSIIARASLVISRQQSNAPISVPADDRFIVKNDLGQTLLRPDPLQTPAEPAVLSRAFTVAADGSRQRTLSLKFSSEDGGEPITVIYSGSAGEYDHLQQRLFWTITLTIAIGMAATFVIARWMSRIVTRPLITTAKTLGEVDEWNLNRRVDITNLPDELKPVGDRLNLMLGRLEEAFIRQRQFLADSAHELRTPVAALRTGIEVALIRQRTPEEMKNVLQRSLSSVERLSDLVKQLLDVSKSGQQSPEAATQVDVKTFLSDRVHELTALADSKDVALSCDLDESPLTMPLPTRSFATVITNLLENAIRHTSRDGTVKLIARWSDVITIEVRDTGIGIAPEHLPRIFEPFYRADAARSSEGGNLGLGLYLVRSNIIRIGGRISCKSEVGKGTSFLIELPLGGDAETIQRH